MIAVIPDNLETLAPIVRPAGALGGGALSPYGRRRPFISLRSELAGDPAQDFTKRHPRLGFDWLRHGSNHEASHDRKPGEAFLESGEVCRERGH